ncbi:superoxide dismutase [Propioniferax innocua]|mgnify:CR=1|uniref:Superoxide dismutase n=1 Tax=Propioniferax innocua TaxID=1753 RepID=A0A542ZS99_9ACTN|nr:superoxide dismutase [Propioniferax innocua]TQL63228.1 Fe-Mn family superoxide dismutase [Propioniferax innocua]
MTYVLPDLDYDYGALAPHIAPEIMELHHSKHHATYVKGLNTATEKLAEARANGDFGAIPKLEKDLAFNLGGHINHSVFWKNMSPEGGGQPEGEIAAAIDEFFGSFEGFKGQFNSVATTLQGSGWSVLAWDILGKKLNIMQLFDQQGNLPVGQIPVLQLDMWEHAFYLQYKNVKADYVDAWWNVVNWNDVTERFNKAKAADLI